jgi:hypothetical protein
MPDQDNSESRNTPTMLIQERFYRGDEALARLARNLVLLVVALGAEVALRFPLAGQRETPLPGISSALGANSSHCDTHSQTTLDAHPGSAITI